MEIVMLSFVFFILIASIFSIYFAIKVNPKFYWLVAILIYLFSYLTSYLSGMFTVGFAFLALSLAIGYSFGWIKSKTSLVGFLIIGLLSGVLIVYYVRDYLFYPF